MISLYQALKSVARVVSALVSAMNPSRDRGDEVRFAHCFLRAASEIPEHHLAPRSLVRAEDNRQAGVSGIGQLQLLADCLGAERILDPKSRIAEPVSQRQQMRKVVLGNERQKHVDASRFGWERLLLLQQLAQYNIAHAEPERRQIDPSHIPQQRIVPSATADRAQRPPRIEQLED